MAEEQDKSQQTEDPTAKKLQDAHDKGDVAKSQEVTTFFVLAAATLVIAVAAGGMSSDVMQDMAVLLERPHAFDISGDAFGTFWSSLARAVLIAVALPFLILMVAAIAGNMVQHRMVLSLEPIKPKLSKISPLAGLKRLFSAESLVNFAKGLIKLTIVSALIVAVCWPELDRLDALVTVDLADVLPEVQALSIRIMLVVLAVVAAIAGADFMWQKHKWFEKQKMTVQEVKDEFKQAEGDPAVKAKIRQLRMERGRQRMMAAVPDASVIVTNPTHFSVALKYERGMGAPVCLAKGIDDSALRIREVAKENDVPIVENPPLARALYATTEIDDEVPEEHFKAVAEVIGFVFRLKQRPAWRSE
ncbi:MAG: flagellar biosynthesis protein FlhB [Pseudomonadota bacterium]